MTHALISARRPAAAMASYGVVTLQSLDTSPMAGQADRPPSVSHPEGATIDGERIDGTGGSHRRRTSRSRHVGLSARPRHDRTGAADARRRDAGTGAGDGVLAGSR